MESRKFQSNFFSWKSDTIKVNLALHQYNKIFDPILLAWMTREGGATLTSHVAWRHGIDSRLNACTSFSFVIFMTHDPNTIIDYFMYFII